MKKNQFKPEIALALLAAGKPDKIPKDMLGKGEKQDAMVKLDLAKFNEIAGDVDPHSFEASCGSGFYKTKGQVIDYVSFFKEDLEKDAGISTDTKKHFTKEQARVFLEKGFVSVTNKNILGISRTDFYAAGENDFPGLYPIGQYRAFVTNEGVGGDWLSFDRAQIEKDAGISIDTKKHFSPEQAKALIEVSLPYESEKIFPRYTPLEHSRPEDVKKRMGPHAPLLLVGAKDCERILGKNAHMTCAGHVAFKENYIRVVTRDELETSMVFSKIELEKEAGISIGDSKVMDATAIEKLCKPNKSVTK